MAVDLFCEVVGTGKPLVCLHAYGLDHSVWNEMALQMESSYQLLLPDLRGHGRSPSPVGSYSMKEMAEDVIAILDHYRVEQAYLAGHSMGGYVMLSFARHYPERISGLALVASQAFEDSPEKRRSRLADIEKVKQLSPMAVLSGMPAKLSYDPLIQKFCSQKISQVDKFGVMGVLAAMAHREDSIKLLRDINVPVGIIAGIDDQFIPIEISRKMAELVKPTIFAELENCGHMPMMENPKMTSEILGKLFSG